MDWVMSRLNKAGIARAVGANALTHLRLHSFDEERYAQITETGTVFPDVLFFYLANDVPEFSRSTEHDPTRRKICIRPDSVGHDACAIFIKGIDLRHETYLGIRTRETIDRLFKVREVRGVSSTHSILADPSRGIGIVARLAARELTGGVNRSLQNETVARGKHILPFRRIHVILPVAHCAFRDIDGKGADLIVVVRPGLRREHQCDCKHRYRHCG